jgi:UDP-N-acetylmuramoyl-tripeptide--D-alanyl-D-alanine ligase
VNAAHAVGDSLLALALAGAFAAQLTRWSRVLQREHYEPASMARFLHRWSSPRAASVRSRLPVVAGRPITPSHALIVAAVACVVWRLDAWAVAASALYGLTCPLGLELRGRTGALVWTRRMTTVAVVATATSLVVAVVGDFAPRPWLAALAVIWLVPLTLAFSARLLEPLERRRARVFVNQASDRLRRVAPRVVAITGSYGKTSTKHHLVDLLGPLGGVVASPRSYNNRAGLSRAINESLSEGTRVFIAEMGTYGPGEIRELCSWCPPEIAVVTAIGPVHLERMKSLEVIEQAKFEITERATTVVVNVDDERLARWVARLVERGARVRTAGSTNSTADVRVAVSENEWTIWVAGQAVATIAPQLGVAPTNLACAAAAAHELGQSVEDLAHGLARVSPVEHRANVVVAPSGVTVVDDTFNANPASAAAALATLAGLELAGRRVVVTPGLIELGDEEYAANAEVGRGVAAIGAELVVVGRTNAASLAEGYASSTRRFDTREHAVAWVRASLGEGDGVLYLNDLPDHYP